MVAAPPDAPPLAPASCLADTSLMGTVHNFRRPPKNRQQFRGWRPPSPKPPKRPRQKWGVAALLALVGAGATLGLIGVTWLGPVEAEQAFECSSPTIIDGDTLRCGERRVRLAGIDAPELPGHCRPGRECTPGDPHASTANLRRLAYAPLQCRATDTDAYGRTVARCSVEGADLSCAQIEGGFAVRRYGWIWC